MRPIRLEKDGLAITLSSGLAVDKKRLSDLIIGTGAASDTVDRFIADPSFPRPCKILRDRTGKPTKCWWFVVDVVAWFINHREMDSRADDLASDILKNL